jgi:hypothetical protein
MASHTSDSTVDGLWLYTLTQVYPHTELEFLKSLWGLETEEEKGYRTGPPGYIGWRNHSLESIPGLHQRLKIRTQYYGHCTVPGVLNKFGRKGR